MKKLTGKHAKMINPDEWPMKGTLEFENVWMRYRYDASWALRGVTFSLKPQEKVGVVGRTGSGKSTLLLALYGMFPLGAGHITFDGVDTQTLPPEKLRKALSIIPQEPLMFSGTVRDNLDPYGEHNDYEIWTALRKVGLKSYVTHLPGKLQAYLDGGDGSWSLGQKQLVCLARAALSHSPVLCLDEATAALDPETESHVLGIIAELFADRTVLTIAHRLDTIIGSDTVMVLDKGELKEMDRPDLLLDDKSSMFSALVDKLGPSMAAGLRQQAKQHAAQMGAVERESSSSGRIFAN